MIFQIKNLLFFFKFIKFNANLSEQSKTSRVNNEKTLFFEITLSTKFKFSHTVKYFIKLVFSKNICKNIYISVQLKKILLLSRKKKNLPLRELQVVQLMKQTKTEKERLEISANEKLREKENRLI